jgi:alpha-N-arabinofuranosidase
VWPTELDTKPKSTHKPTICFDEWNIWDHKRAPGDTGAEELYDVSDMLGVAVWLNVFVRQAKYVGMATIAQSVNVISPLMTTPWGVVRQTTYWPLLLFSRYMRGKTLAVHVCASAYTGRTFPEWLQTTSDTPLLDVSAALSDDGYVNLAVVNISENKSMSTALSVPHTSGTVSVFVVGGNVNGIRDNNTEHSQKVYIRESKWHGDGPYTFEAHSFTLLRWKAESSDMVSNGVAAHREVNELSNGIHLNGVSERS